MESKITFTGLQFDLELQKNYPKTGHFFVTKEAIFKFYQSVFISITFLFLI